MFVVPFLICFPFVVSVLMFCIRVNKIRNAIAYVSAVIIMVAVGVLAVQWGLGGGKTILLYKQTEEADIVISVAELALMCAVTFLCFKYKRYWISLLMIIPTLLLEWLEFFGPELAPVNHVRVDHLAVLMCIIIGLIGGLIIVYAVGYMHGYHHHHLEFQDRRYYFFMLLFAFLGAMFGFVLSASLLWIDLFWEITSICSFLLIGYTKTDEAIENSFRALWMNLLGGTALAGGILYFALTQKDVSLINLVEKGVMGNAATVIPIALIAFAALTKSAQLPFSKWLMGAMVAPTPSSALLHSATMVKAGIYILFRLSPAMADTLTGSMVTFIGGFTFFMASLMAMAQSDGKKVLALSTVSNLGLMVACAGVGQAETVWAGIFLMIFHAISKSMLFQDMGAIENSTHTRDIEDLNGLIYRLPMLGRIMFIGIAGMYLAPFGMLVSKWAALRASVNEHNIILALLICFGSATTMFYWTKWLNRLLSSTTEPKIRDITKKNEQISLIIHAILMIALCVLFPVLSTTYVEPLLLETFGYATAALPSTLLYVLIVVIMVIFAVPLIAYSTTKNIPANQKISYMSGANRGNNRDFTDSLGEPKELQLSNWYFKNYVGQRKLMEPSSLLAAAVIIVMLSMIIGGALR
ncbi:MAG: NADH-quinone oxidoreductase subunit L [Lachnospiraceae bacterium]|nr:NADH-quinone oxidoreductase subunit L [Lachnospiraceae bacterium]